MRFLIDENLPPAVAELFREAGLQATHINEFESRKPIKDDGIRRYALHYPDAVVVSRDDDFVRSYFSRKVPDKVIYVFNIQSKTEILDAFEQHLPELAQLSQSHSLIELNPSGIKVHQ